MIYKVEDIFLRIRNGMNIKQEMDAGGLPITRIETIANAEINLERVGYANLGLEQASNFLLEDGEILFSHINSVSHIGKCAIYMKEMGELVHGMNLLSFKPNPTLLFPKYALYALRSIQFKDQLSKSIKKAVNQASVSISDIKNILLDVPTLAEQKRIATILDKAAEIKAKREQAIAKLDELAQSIFVEMFGSNPSNSCNGQLVKLSELCDLQNGYAFKSTDYVESSSVLNCRMSNIRPNGDFDILYNAKYLPNSFAEKYKSFLLADDDIIIAMTDMAGEPKILGVPTIVDTKGYKLLLNQRVGKLTFHSKKRISIIYLKYALSQSYVKKYYRQFASGGVQINLGKADLLSINLLLPNDEEQMIFEKKIKFIEQQKMKYMNALSVSSAVQLSLQQQAFKSEFNA